MTDLDSSLVTRALTEEASIKIETIFMEHEEVLKNEEISWSQRSGVLWLKEGDKNTMFFHQSANTHRRYNHIDQLVIQGSL